MGYANSRTFSIREIFMRALLIVLGLTLLSALLILFVGYLLPNLISAPDDASVLLAFILIALPVIGTSYYVYKKLSEDL